MPDELARLVNASKLLAVKLGASKFARSSVLKIQSIKINLLVFSNFITIKAESNYVPLDLA